MALLGVGIFLERFLFSSIICRYGASAFRRIRFSFSVSSWGDSKESFLPANGLPG